MEGGGIEIGAVGPDERVNLGVEADLIENGWVAQGAEKFAGQDRLKIDDLFGGVIKSNAQDVWALNLKRTDAVDWMNH